MVAGLCSAKLETPPEHPSPRMQPNTSRRSFLKQSAALAVAAPIAVLVALPGWRKKLSWLTVTLLLGVLVVANAGRINERFSQGINVCSNLTYSIPNYITFRRDYSRSSSFTSSASALSSCASSLFSFVIYLVRIHK